MEFKFATRDFVGNPVEYYLARKVDVPKPVVEKEVGHHIVIVDRSGSMYGVIRDTKTMVEKVMTVEEFKDASLLLSLISYSSEGDVTVHFSRRTVADILRPGSVEIEELRRIQATSLTCASQALEAASGLLGDETTAISLHTDGWFNHKSPDAEKKKIEKTLKELEKNPKVFVNCVSHGNYTDFSYLSSIANRMSGSCILASTVKEVYEALHNTNALLAGRVVPAIPVGIEGADWQVVHNLKQRKVNGAAHDLIVRGAAPEDPIHIFRFSKVNEATYAKSPFPETVNNQAVAMFARSKLAAGKINEAKYAFLALRDSERTIRHYNAISSDRLMAFALDLDAIIAGAEIVTSETYGIGFKGEPLTELFQVLNHNRAGFVVNLAHMLNVYQRRGIQKLNGKFDESGTFVPNNVELVPVAELSEDPWVGVTGFEVNTSEATINMGIARDAELKKDGQRVNRIGGTRLDLSLLRQYTLIGDGSVLVPELQVLFNSKSLFDEVKALGFLDEGAEFLHRQTIQLHKFPVVRLTASELHPPTANELVMYGQALVAEKILKAVLPVEASGTQEWTPEQVEELRSYGLTPKLYFSAPSTVPYVDRDKAIGEGLIDSYTRYTVSFGTEHASDIRTSLWSANEALQRYCEVEGIKKPKFSDLPSGKKITSKVVKNHVALDSLVRGVLDGYIEQKVWEWPVERIEAQLDGFRKEIETVESVLSEIALSVGSTGLIPDDWNAEIVTTEQLEAKFPTMDIPKAHAEGTFFKVGSAYVGVHAEVAWYSTTAGLTAAEALEASA
jgi:hypothetical protein